MKQEQRARRFPQKRPPSRKRSLERQMEEMIPLQKPLTTSSITTPTYSSGAEHASVGGILLTYHLFLRLPIQ